jgi:hypothetical protein
VIPNNVNIYKISVKSLNGGFSSYRRFHCAFICSSLSGSFFVSFAQFAKSSHVIAVAARERGQGSDSSKWPHEMEPTVFVCIVTAIACALLTLDGTGAKSAFSLVHAGCASCDG